MRRPVKLPGPRSTQIAPSRPASGAGSGRARRRSARAAIPTSRRARPLPRRSPPAARHGDAGDRRAGCRRRAPANDRARTARRHAGLSHPAHVIGRRAPSSAYKKESARHVNTQPCAAHADAAPLPPGEGGAPRRASCSIGWATSSRCSTRTPRRRRRFSRWRSPRANAAPRAKRRCAACRTTRSTATSASWCAPDSRSRSATRSRTPRRPRVWSGARSRASSRPARSASPSCSRARRRTSWRASGLARRGDGRRGAFLDVSTGKLLVHRWRDGRRRGGRASPFCAARAGVRRGGAAGATVGLGAIASGGCRSPLDADDRCPTRGRAGDLLERQFGAPAARASGSRPGSRRRCAAAAALDYARRRRRARSRTCATLAVLEEHDFLVLDDTTLANLEVVRALRDGRPAGHPAPAPRPTARRRWAARRLRAGWCVPLRRPRADRWRATTRSRSCAATRARRDELRALLGQIADLERLLARAALGSLHRATPARCATSLREAPRVHERSPAAARRCSARWRAPTRAPTCWRRSTRAWSTEPPAALRDRRRDRRRRRRRARPLPLAGRATASATSRRSRRASASAPASPRSRSATTRCSATTSRSPTRTGARVPDDYQRRQTLTNAERYVTPRAQGARGARSSAPRSAWRSSSPSTSRALRRARSRARRDSARAGATRWRTLDALARSPRSRSRHGYARPRMVEPGAGSAHPRRAPSGGRGGAARATLRAERHRPRCRRARRSCSSPAPTWAASPPICARWR